MDAHLRLLRLKAVAACPKGAVVGVVGLGVTGLAVAQLWRDKGARLVLIDADPEKKKAAEAFCDDHWVTGPTPEDALDGCDIAIVSPGVLPQLACLQRAVARGIAVAGELELISLFAPLAPTIAITGTNGKSTTTHLIGALLGLLGPPPFVGGNLGEPMSRWLAEPRPLRPAVLELSSYQIDGAQAYRPHTAVVLNVAEDHLARYGTLEAYAASKARLPAWVGPTGAVILNADDPYVCAMAQGCSARIWWFSAHRLPAGASGLVLGPHDTFVAHGELKARIAPFSLAHPTLLGEHNRMNTLAALLAIEASGWLGPAARAGLADAYLATHGLAHRLRPVRTIDDVVFINDSKATNDASTAVAIAAVTQPKVVLLGGQSKKDSYEATVMALNAADVRAVILFGPARHELREALVKRQDTLETETLDQAFGLAVQTARPGDAVLLSPACKSFDAFRDFRHRGESFEAWVEALATARKSQ